MYASTMVFSVNLGHVFVFAAASFGISLVPCRSFGHLSVDLISQKFGPVPADVAIKRTTFLCGLIDSLAIVRLQSSFNRIHWLMVTIVEIQAIDGSGWVVNMHVVVRSVLGSRHRPRQSLSLVFLLIWGVVKV
jgi:hypothetical protein